MHGIDTCMRRIFCTLRTYFLCQFGVTNETRLFVVTISKQCEMIIKSRVTITLIRKHSVFTTSSMEDEKISIVEESISSLREVEKRYLVMQVAICHIHFDGQAYLATEFRT